MVELIVAASGISGIGLLGLMWKAAQWQARTDDKLDQLIAEMHPNGGSTIKDALNRVELKVERMDSRLVRVEERVKERQ